MFSKFVYVRNDELAFHSFSLDSYYLYILHILSNFIIFNPYITRSNLFTIWLTDLRKSKTIATVGIEKNGKNKTFSTHKTQSIYADICINLAPIFNLHRKKNTKNRHSFRIFANPNTYHNFGSSFFYVVRICVRPSFYPLTKFN